MTYLELMNRKSIKKLMSDVIGMSCLEVGVVILGLVEVVLP